MNAASNREYAFMQLRNYEKRNERRSGKRTGHKSGNRPTRQTREVETEGILFKLIQNKEKPRVKASKESLQQIQVSIIY